MAAFASEGPDTEMPQLLKEIVTEIRRTNKLLAEIRDLQASRPH